MRELADDPTKITSPTRRWIWTVAVGSRVLLFVLGAAAISSPGYVPTADAAPPVSSNRFVNLPYRWDGEWYVSIARLGYRWAADLRHEQQSIAFFPAYPILMRVAGDALTVIAHVLRWPGLPGGDDARAVWGGVLVSLLCFGFAAERLYALTLLDTHAPIVARRSVVLLACYPFALFLALPYSESLTLLALTSTLLAWRQGRLVAAGMWGMVTGLARSNGWTLCLALLADWWLRRPAGEHSAARAAAAGAPLVGTVLYSAYIYAVTGNALEWVVAQRAWVGFPGVLEFATRRARSVLELGLLAHVRSDSVDAIAVACVLLTLGLAAWLLRQRHYLYAMVLLCYLAPALAVDLAATGRLTTVLFPAFIALACVTGRTSAIAFGTLFAIAQAWLAWLLFQWRPPY